MSLNGASRAGSKSTTEESTASTVDESDTEGERPEAPTTPSMDAPVRTLQDKWRLLPHFLALRGLMKQHIGAWGGWRVQ